MKPILDTIEFFHAMRSQMRFGEFSRLPIRVRRFEISGELVECDWFMRPPDPWDVHLPARQQQEHMTQQALHDALKFRELIFRGFSGVQRAGLRMYREQEGAEPRVADGRRRGAHGAWHGTGSVAGDAGAALRISLLPGLRRAGANCSGGT